MYSGKIAVLPGGGGIVSMTYYVPILFRDIMGMYQMITLKIIKYGDFLLYFYLFIWINSEYDEERSTHVPILSRSIVPLKKIIIQGI
jgi:hypothetical protein